MITQKKFKQTEIGMIPEDWNVVQFRTVLSQNIRHGIYKSKEYFDHRGVRLLKMGDINSNDRISDQNMERVFVSEEELKRFRIQDGNLIFARTSMMTGGLGNCSIVMKHDDPIIFDGNLLCADIDTKVVEPEFYFYYFKSKRGQNEIAKMTTGTQSRNIPGSKLMEVNVPILSKGEQHQIAYVLSCLDFKIKLNQQMNQTLGELGKIVFKQWFIDFEFPNERDKPYKSSGGEMVYNEELGQDIPKGWKSDELGKFIEFVKGKKPLEISHIFIDDYLPQILIENLDGKNPVYAKPYKTIIVQETEPIMVMDGASSGRTEIGHKGILGSTLAKIIVNSNLLSNSYVFHYLKSKQEEINQNTTGTSIPHTDKDKVKKFLIALPTEDLLKNFDKIFLKILYKILNNKREIEVLSVIKDSLLPKLMSGKIRFPSEAT